MDALPDAAYVYMVRCTGGQLYTGWTNHPAARLKAHQSGKGARYTRAHGAVGFAYLERCADKRAALRREAALKKLSGQTANLPVTPEAPSPRELAKPSGFD